MNTPRTIGRRHFLLGAGGAALVIPTLSSLFGREAAAGEPARPRNFVSWRIANGFYGQQWYPSAANSAALQVVEPNVRELALTDIQGPVSEILDARFDPFRAKSNLLRHIDRLDWGDHNAASGLLGWSDSAASLAGKTFSYSEKGPEGLLKGRKAYLVTATGGLVFITVGWFK